MCWPNLVTMSCFEFKIEPEVGEQRIFFWRVFQVFSSARLVAENPKPPLPCFPIIDNQCHNYFVANPIQFVMGIHPR